MTNDIIIQTEQLTKQYGEQIILDNISLTVRKHSICGFLGPNGAGKSTTIKLLLGLARPTSGSATVFGMDVRHNSLAIRQRVGYLAQDPRYYQRMTAREILRFTANFFYRDTSQVIERRVNETLALVDLLDKADCPIKGFSGGERQRLGIAQAQINHPDLLILDEPAAALDPMGRRDVLNIMNRLREHTTIFYSTHILDDVQRVSDTVAILSKGKLVAQAPIDELLAGTGSVVYQVGLKGNANDAEARLREQPWVASVQPISQNGISRWQVSVHDADLAEARLLPMLMQQGDVTVIEFNRKQSNLEDVFMNLVEA